MTHPVIGGEVKETGMEGEGTDGGERLKGIGRGGGRVELKRKLHD